MEAELSTKDLLRGLKDESMKDHELVLFQILANKVAENPDQIQPDEINEVYDISLASLDRTISNEAIHTILILLSNMTTIEYNTEQFLVTYDKKDSFKEGFRRIIDKFLDYNPQLEEKDVDVEQWPELDPWGGLSLLLCNLCQNENGRKIFLSQSSGYMKDLIKQVFILLSPFVTLGN